MPTEDLRKNLAKSKIEAARRLEELKNDRSKTTRKFENWNKALEAFSLGWRMPQPRYHVVISPDSLVSTPQKLQEMVGMTETPKVINTTYTTFHGGLNSAHLQADGKPEEVQVGEVSWRELTEITDKTECDQWLFAFIDGEVRGITLIKSYKDDDKNGKEQEPSDGVQEENPGTSPCELHDVQTESTV